MSENLKAEGLGSESSHLQRTRDAESHSEDPRNHLESGNPRKDKKTSAHELASSGSLRVLMPSHRQKINTSTNYDISNTSSGALPFSRYGDESGIDSGEDQYATASGFEKECSRTIGSAGTDGQYSSGDLSESRVDRKTFSSARLSSLKSSQNSSKIFHVFRSKEELGDDATTQSNPEATYSTKSEEGLASSSSLMASLRWAGFTSTSTQSGKEPMSTTPLILGSLQSLAKNSSNYPYPTTKTSGFAGASDTLSESALISDSKVMRKPGSLDAEGSLLEPPHSGSVILDDGLIPSTELLTTAITAGRSTSEEQDYSSKEELLERGKSGDMEFKARISRLSQKSFGETQRSHAQRFHKNNQAEQPSSNASALKHMGQQTPAFSGSSQSLSHSDAIVCATESVMNPVGSRTKSNSIEQSSTEAAPIMKPVSNGNTKRPESLFDIRELLKTTKGNEAAPRSYGKRAATITGRISSKSSIGPSRRGSLLSLQTLSLGRRSPSSTITSYPSSAKGFTPSPFSSTPKTPTSRKSLTWNTRSISPLKAKGPSNPVPRQASVVVSLTSTGFTKGLPSKSSGRESTFTSGKPESVVSIPAARKGRGGRKATTALEGERNGVLAEGIKVVKKQSSHKLSDEDGELRTMSKELGPCVGVGPPVVGADNLAAVGNSEASTIGQQLLEEEGVERCEPEHFSNAYGEAGVNSINIVSRSRPQLPPLGRSGNLKWDGAIQRNSNTSERFLETGPDGEDGLSRSIVGAAPAPPKKAIVKRLRESEQPEDVDVSSEPHITKKIVGQVENQNVFSGGDKAADPVPKAAVGAAGGKVMKAQAVGSSDRTVSKLEETLNTAKAAKKLMKVKSMGSQGSTPPKLREERPTQENNPEKAAQVESVADDQPAMPEPTEKATGGLVEKPTKKKVKKTRSTSQSTTPKSGKGELTEENITDKKGNLQLVTEKKLAVSKLEKKEDAERATFAKITKAKSLAKQKLAGMELEEGRPTEGDAPHKTMKAKRVVGQQFAVPMPQEGELTEKGMAKKVVPKRKSIEIPKRTEVKPEDEGSTDEAATNRMAQAKPVRALKTMKQKAEDEGPTDESITKQMVKTNSVGVLKSKPEDGSTDAITKKVTKGKSVRGKEAVSLKSREKTDQKEGPYQKVTKAKSLINQKATSSALQGAELSENDNSQKGKKAKSVGGHKSTVENLGKEGQIKEGVRMKVPKANSLASKSTTSLKREKKSLTDEEDSNKVKKKASAVSIVTISSREDEGANKKQLSKGSKSRSIQDPMVLGLEKRKSAAARAAETIKEGEPYYEETLTFEELENVNSTASHIEASRTSSVAGAMPVVPGKTIKGAAYPSAGAKNTERRIVNGNVKVRVSETPKKPFGLSVISNTNVLASECQPATSGIDCTWSELNSVFFF